jgi:hypothetical protein
VLWGGWHLSLFLTEWGGPHVTWVMPVEFILPGNSRARRADNTARSGHDRFGLPT